MRITLLLAFLIAQVYSFAQVDLGYQVPDKAILDLVDAPMPPVVRINSEGTKAVLMYRKSYKSIAELSETELRLAGLRINPKTNIGSRTRFFYDIKLLDVNSGQQTEINGLPNNSKIAHISWSPDDMSNFRIIR